jgi:putative transcriptional regulator
MLSLIVRRAFIVFVASLAVSFTLSPPCSCPSSAAGVADVAPMQAPSITGKWLIASDAMPDGYFAGTRILMLDHDATGALGIVMNRPLPDAGADFPVLAGGPVGRDSIVIVHDTSFASSATQRLFGDIAVTTDESALDALAEGAGPEHLFVAWGYAGWGPQQLEGELAQGVWRVEERTAPIWPTITP